jgi:hypothetical protein
MDPIRTAVKYSLIPLRTIVQIGDAFVGTGEEAAPMTPVATATKRTQQRKRTQARKTAASRQATQAPKDLDDVAVARKVETIIFRDESVDKGKISVNAADGVVWLRGEAKTPEQITELEAAASAIPEVKNVENLLHLPKAPARRPKPSRAPKPSATGVTNEGVTAHGEPSPVEAAREGEGRQPAPLGSNGSSS